MMVPTVHMNGTAASVLMEEAEEAVHRISHAIDAVRQMTVNGRDYYPQGIDALGQATREHEARLNALREVQRELRDYINALAEAQP